MPENGTLIEIQAVELNRPFQATVLRLYDRSVLENTVVERLRYRSDGLQVAGYMARPKEPGVYPVLLWNRGGYAADGALTDLTAYLILASTAVWGYVVLATQYRGNDGGEGTEDWGGDDVNDAYNLISVAGQIPECDTNRIAVEGASRGGITTYRLLTMYPDFKCAIVHAGTTDLPALAQARTGFFTFMRQLFGAGTPEAYEAALRRRSAVYWAEKFPRKTPILMLHGTTDDRIPVDQSLKLDSLLTQYQVPHELVLIQGGGHIALKDGSYRDIDRYRKNWLKKYLG